MIKPGLSSSDQCRHTAEESSPLEPIELNFITGKQARQALRRGEDVFIAWVTARESNPSKMELDIPSVTQAEGKRQADLLDILTEYQDIFPQELPFHYHRRGLSTMRLTWNLV